MGSGVASSISPPETCGSDAAFRHAALPLGKVFVLVIWIDHSRPESRVRGFYNVCLRDMIKPHDRLVPVSSVDCSTSTPGLSTS